MRVIFEIEHSEVIVDGLRRDTVNVSSPDVPGLHVVGGDLHVAMLRAGQAMERLIRDNKIERLYSLVPGIDAGF